MRNVTFILVGCVISTIFTIGMRKASDWYFSQERQIENKIEGMAKAILPNRLNGDYTTFIVDNSEIKIRVWPEYGNANNKERYDSLIIRVGDLRFKSDNNDWAELEYIYNDYITLYEDDISKEEWQKYQQIFYSYIEAAYRDSRNRIKYSLVQLENQSKEKESNIQLVEIER
jgi:hypothetical protein